MSCCICLEELYDKSKKNKNKNTTIMQCNHVFHTECLKKWFKNDKNYDSYSGTCPLCRQIGSDDSDFESIPSVTMLICSNLFRMIKPK